MPRFCPPAECLRCALARGVLALLPPDLQALRGRHALCLSDGLRDSQTDQGESASTRLQSLGGAFLFRSCSQARAEGSTHARRHPYALVRFRTIT